MGTSRTIFQGLKLTSNIYNIEKYVKGNREKKLDKGINNNSRNCQRR